MNGENHGFFKRSKPMPLECVLNNNCYNMKKLGLLIASISLCIMSFGQVSNATDFTVDDCDGKEHNLFSQLDAGKIIVLGWTMPCASCARPLLEVHNAVLEFAISNPGVVEYWVADDYGSTQCSSIKEWCSRSGITNVVTFSSTDIDMMDYGSEGMPKVVVLGCSDRKVYYNVDNFPTGAGVTSAINTALDDMETGCQPAGVNELNGLDFAFECYPNPAFSSLNISFNPNYQQNLTLEVYDITGSLLNSIPVKGLNDDTQNVLVDISDFDNGMYILKMVGNQVSASTSFSVVK